jgi:hypothetical protein
MKEITMTDKKALTPSAADSAAIYLHNMKF